MEITEKIIAILTPMGPVEVTLDKENLVLSKYGIEFAILKGQDLYFRSEDEQKTNVAKIQYDEVCYYHNGLSIKNIAVDRSTLDCQNAIEGDSVMRDRILVESTKSYWISKLSQPYLSNKKSEA